MILKVSRRRALQALGAIGAPSIVPFHAWSQGLPDKPVSILVGFAPGGGIDLLARFVAPRLESRIGRHVRVENHAGANGSLVGDALKKGRPGGTLIGAVPSSTVEARVAVANYSFDPQVDMVPLSLAGTYPMVLAVSPQIEVDTLPQFIEWLKGGDKARRRLGLSANDGFLDFNALLFGAALGTPLQGVPYRGGPPLLNDVRDNKLPAAVATLPSTIEYHRGGKVKIIVTSSDKRVPVAPKLQAAFEYGLPTLTATEWYGFFASPGTPEPIIDLWNMHIRAVLAEPELAAKLTNVGLVIQPSEPHELVQRVAESMKQVRDRMLALGLQPSR
jgi:tripartite-type tricarboxylate transporter receptor subunit TctC